MKLHSTLSITSLLSILFMTLHLTDDIHRNQNGMAQGGFGTLLIVLILVVWLYAALLLVEKRSGYIIHLIGSLLASFVAFGHLTGIGDVVVGEIAKSSGNLFVWAVVALGVTAISSLNLAARGLWSMQRGSSR